MVTKGQMIYTQIFMLSHLLLNSTSPPPQNNQFPFSLYMLLNSHSNGCNPQILWSFFFVNLSHFRALGLYLIENKNEIMINLLLIKENNRVANSSPMDITKIQTRKNTLYDPAPQMERKNQLFYFSKCIVNDSPSLGFMELRCKQIPLVNFYRRSWLSNHVYFFFS